MKWVMVVVLMLALLSGCMRIVDENGNVYELARGEHGVYAESLVGEQQSPQTVLRALVKGSIYESGEAVSVFGTCLDGDDQPYPNVTAYLSSWYPNGTQHLTAVNMTEFQAGYFVYQGPMESVGGTYLTEMRCVHTPTGKFATAYGEWQNPAWVARIATIQNTTDSINTTVQNISVELGELQVQVNDSFEITFNQLTSINTTLNDTYNNLSEQIYYAAQVANGSVDRNDSYLADLLNDILGQIDPGNGSALIDPNWTETWDEPIYYRSDWELRVDVYDPNDGNSRVVYPDVYCVVNTTQTPIPQTMDPVGNHFLYGEFVGVRGDFEWTVDCLWT